MLPPSARMAGPGRMFAGPRMVDGVSEQNQPAQESGDDRRALLRASLFLARLGDRDALPREIGLGAQHGSERQIPNEKTGEAIHGTPFLVPVSRSPAH